MPAKIPASTREEVFQSWLGGLFRHQIAIKHGVSEATVSNVVAEYRLRYGSELIDQLRALSLGMSRSGLSFSECAKGHRIEMVLRNMGAEEGQFEEFILKFWELYKKTGLAPNQIVNEIDELHYFRECNQSMNRAGVSIPKICADIRMKQNELKSLETNCDKVQEVTSDLLHQRAAIEDELKFNNELKEKLKAKGLQTNELLDTADLTAFVKKSGYSIREVKERFATFSELDRACAIINDKVLKEGIRNDQLKRDNEFLEEKISKSSQRLRELELLEMKGFGLKEFKMLDNLLNEIAEQMGMPTELKAAVKAFFDSLNSRYYDYLDLGKKMAELEEKRNIMNISMNLGQEIVEGLELLVRKGFKKGDLEGILKFIVQNHTPDTPATTLTSTTTTTSSDIKSKSGNKMFADSNVAGGFVRTNEAERLKGLDPAALVAENDNDEVRLSKEAEKIKATVRCFRDGVMSKPTKRADDVLMQKKDALTESNSSEGASNRINNFFPHPRTSHEKQHSELTSGDLKKKLLGYQKYKSIVNPHQLEGLGKKGEFYGTNVLDALAHLYGKYGTRTSNKLYTQLNDTANYSCKWKNNDLTVDEAVGPGQENHSKARSEPEELSERKYRVSGTTCHIIAEQERNSKTPHHLPISLRKSVLSLLKKLETNLSHEFNNGPQLDKHGQILNLGSLIDDAILCPLLRQLSELS